MRQLTDEALSFIRSPFLYSVDLSGCTKVSHFRPLVLVYLPQVTPLLPSYIFTQFFSSS